MSKTKCILLSAIVALGFWATPADAAGSAAVDPAYRQGGSQGFDAAGYARGYYSEVFSQQVESIKAMIRSIAKSGIKPNSVRHGMVAGVGPVPIQALIQAVFVKDGTHQLLVDPSPDARARLSADIFGPAKDGTGVNWEKTWIPVINQAFREVNEEFDHVFGENAPQASMARLRAQAKIVDGDLAHLPQVVSRELGHEKPGMSSAPSAIESSTAPRWELRVRGRRILRIQNRASYLQKWRGFIGATAPGGHISAEVMARASGYSGNGASGTNDNGRDVGGHFFGEYSTSARKLAKDLGAAGLRRRVPNWMPLVRSPLGRQLKDVDLHVDRNSMHAGNKGVVTVGAQVRERQPPRGFTLHR